MLDDLTEEEFEKLIKSPWYMELWWKVREKLYFARCFFLNHDWQWYGGVVDYESGETDGEQMCKRCGLPAQYHDTRTLPEWWKDITSREGR